MSNLNTLTLEIADINKALKEIRKTLPDYERLVRIAERYDIDTAFIYESMERNIEAVDQQKDLKKRLETIKDEIQYIWKQT